MAERTAGALIVGGGTGIGYATAERFVRRGVPVAISGRRAEVLADAARRLRSTRVGSLVETVAADGAVTDDAQRMVDHAVAAFGRLGVLVNCAGIYEPA